MGKKSEMDQLSLGLQTQAAGERLFEEIPALARLELAYAKVRANGGSPGPDGQSIERQMERANSWYLGWSSYYAMINYPNQLRQVEAHIRMRFRLQFVKNHKRKKHQVRALRRQGVKGHAAYRAVYLKNSRRWKLAHDFVVNRAWTLRWFRQRGMATRSGESRRHWQGIEEYPRPV